jgi:hypothetical protein
MTLEAQPISSAVDEQFIFKLNHTIPYHTIPKTICQNQIFGFNIILNSTSILTYDLSKSNFCNNKHFVFNLNNFLLTLIVNENLINLKNRFQQS